MWSWRRVPVSDQSCGVQCAINAAIYFIAAFIYCVANATAALKSKPAYFSPQLRQTLIKVHKNW